MKAARQAAELVEQEEAAAKGAAPAAADAGAAAPSSSSSAAAGASSSSSSKANGKRRAGPNDDATTTNKRPANDTTTAAAAAAAAAETAVHGRPSSSHRTRPRASTNISCLFVAALFSRALRASTGPLSQISRDGARGAAHRRGVIGRGRGGESGSLGVGIEEHGELLGWKVDDTEEAEEEEAAGGTSGGAIAAEEDHGPAIIAEDGNFDDCAVCGGGGELICCESCPQAYHRECLGQGRRPRMMMARGSVRRAQSSLGWSEVEAS